VSWTSGLECSDCGCWPKMQYEAIVLAAYNASGPSVFAIADPGGWTTKEAAC
jgi:hypothetical protein